MDRPYVKSLMCALLLSCSHAVSRSSADNTAENNSANRCTVPGLVPTLVNAGADQEVKPGTRVVLDGRRSYHPQGRDFQVYWSQREGAAPITFDNPAALMVEFTAPAQEQVLSFRLTAESGLTSFDDVVIHVVGGQPRRAPVVLGGGDRVVASGAAITLSAEQSLGQGAVVWRLIKGDPTPLATSSTEPERVSLTAPDAGAMVLSVESRENGLASAPDYVTLIVCKPSGASPALIADNTPAEDNSGDVVAPASDVLLKVDSRASVWVQLFGEPVVRTPDADPRSWRFTAPAHPGDLVFAYFTDASGARGSPFLRTIHVRDPLLEALVADAGPDRLAHPGNPITLDGTKSVLGPSDAKVRPAWAQTQGPQAITLADPATLAPSFTAPAQEGRYAFVLTLAPQDGAGQAEPDSAVVTVRAASLNDGPTVSLTGAPAGANVTLTALFSDPESDPLAGATWQVTAGTLSVVGSDGGGKSQRSWTGAVTGAKATCQVCDVLGACDTATFTAP